MREKTNYGNWVPEKALYMLFGGAAILLVAAIVSGVMGVVPVITWIAGVIGVLMLVMAVYMLICHEEFAFGKGNMMAGVHQHLVDHLDWDGKGELLDIGWTTGEPSGIMPKSSVRTMRVWKVLRTG